MASKFVACPICAASVPALLINEHIDSQCRRGSARKRAAPRAAASASAPLPRAKRERVRHDGAHGGDKPSAAPSASWSAIGLGARRRQTLDAAEQPLAERVRPTSLGEMFGQPTACGALQHILSSGRALPSLILWGPPGCGKTTAARIVAAESGLDVVALSAVTAGVKDVRDAVAAARTCARGIVLFVDEVHRFNKAQQDAFLPHVESGLIKLIGATTENPSFSLNNALLSRCTVVEFSKLAAAPIVAMLSRALARDFPLLDVATAATAAAAAAASAGVETVSAGEHGAVAAIVATSALVVAAPGPAPLELLAALADGDGRIALNSLEQAANRAMALASTSSSSSASPRSPASTLATDGQATGGRGSAAPRALLTSAIVTAAVERAQALMDRKGDQHYQLISALHKTMRGSDVGASLYWLARQLASGEDPRYVCRRLMQFAAEDVGLADPHAVRHRLFCCFVRVPRACTRSPPPPRWPPIAFR
jgi:putative ATPase